MRSASHGRLACGVWLTASLGFFAPFSAQAEPSEDAATTAGAERDAPAPVPGAAAQQAPWATSSKVFPPLASPSLSHRAQLGIALLTASGFRALFPYQEGIYCGQPGKRVCTARIPTYMDVQPSFGLSDGWDVLVDLRFGLEPDFARTHQFAIAPGFRYWIDPQQRVKFFATLQFAYDGTEQHTKALTGYDLAFRNSDGLMFEVMRDLGFYAQLGDTIGFVRWLRFEIDLGAGVQARFP
jgi:hypothetical protein